MVQLGRQLFIGGKPEADGVKIMNLENLTPGEIGNSRPVQSGLWTSSYDERIGSAWAQRVKDGSLYKKLHREWWLLTPSPDANIYEINGRDALDKLVARYPCEFMKGHFRLHLPAVRADYDALHLTEEGLNMDRSLSAYSLSRWDVESTHWFRWCFDNVEQIPLPKWYIDAGDKHGWV